MAASALQLLPTLIDVEPGRDAYTTPQLMRSHLKGASASWWLHGQPVSLKRADGSYIKNALSFSDHHDNPDAFYALLDECLARGCRRPSGYPAAFHKLYRSAAVPWSVNAMFAARFAGGWQEALTPGSFTGQHIRYDLRSAYLSALGDWLPDPATYHYSEDLRDGGLYDLDIEPTPGAPYPFDTWPRVNATAEEVELYELRVKRVRRGVAWHSTVGTDEIRDALLSLSFWKQAARAYWGRWAMVEPVECKTVSNRWDLPSRFANLPWAHLIVGRVRMRLWHEVMLGDVRHVYVDSIICTMPRKIDPRIGGWKLEHIYTDGVTIAGPGHYGPLNGPVEKWAGLRRSDPRRTLYVSNAFGLPPR